MNSYRLFTKHQLDNLRKEYDRVEGIDPNTNGYKLLTSFLDSQPQNVLAQLAGANIKFLSKLARNRVKGVA